jgi:hypothetical protein
MRFGQAALQIDRNVGRVHQRVMDEATLDLLLRRNPARLLAG